MKAEEQRRDVIDLLALVVLLVVAVVVPVYGSSWVRYPLAARNGLVVAWAELPPQCAALMRGAIACAVVSAALFLAYLPIWVACRRRPRALRLFTPLKLAAQGLFFEHLALACASLVPAGVGFLLELQVSLLYFLIPALLLLGLLAFFVMPVALWVAHAFRRRRGPLGRPVEPVPAALPYVLAVPAMIAIFVALVPDGPDPLHEPPLSLLFFGPIGLFTWLFLGMP